MPLDLEQRRHRLEVLREEARGCEACPDMAGRPRTMGDPSATLEERCLVVATAPGPTKAGATDEPIPLDGDHTGDAFSRLLADADLRRDQLYVTNAVLCPPRRAGRSRKVRAAEIANCSRFLSGLMVVLDPAIVVTLGTTALRAVGELAPHGLTLQRDVGGVHRWMGRWLLPLYHPWPRAMIHRPWAAQRRDYATWRSLMD
jgi:uracil-DNA glycosylase family 4